MNRTHFHLCGVAFLLLASLATWRLSRAPSTPAPVLEQSPSSRKISERKVAPSTASSRVARSTQPRKLLLKSDYMELRIGSSSSWARTLDQKKETLASILALPPSKTRDEAVSSILASIAKDDPDYAKEQWLAWEHALTEPWLEAASAICLALAKDDPFAPSDFIAQHIPRAAHLQAWHPILQKMDFQPATEVLATLPKTNLSIKIAKSLSLRWIKADPTSCLNWLDTWLPTLTTEQRKSLGNRYPLWGHPLSGQEGFKIYLSAYRQATHPMTRVYLAHVALKIPGSYRDKELEELKHSFREELENSKQ